MPKFSNKDSNKFDEKEETIFKNIIFSVINSTNLNLDDLSKTKVNTDVFIKNQAFRELFHLNENGEPTTDNVTEKDISILAKIFSTINSRIADDFLSDTTKNSFTHSHRTLNLSTNKFEEDEEEYERLEDYKKDQLKDVSKKNPEIQKEITSSIKSFWKNDKDHFFNKNNKNLLKDCILDDFSNKLDFSMRFDTLNAIDKVYNAAEVIHVKKLIESIEQSGKSSFKNSNLSGTMYNQLYKISTYLSKGKSIEPREWNNLYNTARDYLAYKCDNGYNSNAYGKIYAADSIMKLCKSHVGGDFENDLLLFNNDKPTKESIKEIIRERSAEISTEKLNDTIYKTNKEPITYNNLLKESIKEHHEVLKNSTTSKVTSHHKTNQLGSFSK